MILDCFSVVNHQDSSFVNIDIMKKYKNTVRAHPGHLCGLSVFHSRSTFYGGFV